MAARLPLKYTHEGLASISESQASKARAEGAAAGREARRSFYLPKSMISSSVLETSERYIQVRAIGEGTFGAVRLVWDSELKCARALKTFKPEADGNISECALREIAFQSFLTDANAPGIVPFLAVLLGEGAQVSMLMPLMEQDLADAIGSKNFDTWECARPVLLDVLQAVSFLHSHSPPIMHRDLKPENVLLDPTGKAYLTDLGFMRFCKDGPPFETGPLSCGSNQRATKTYSAPEMLRHGVPHGPPVDAWAIGVIAAELAHNARLTALTDKTARKQLRALRDKLQAEPQKALVTGLLQEDPAARWSAAEALERSFAAPAFAHKGHAAPDVIRKEPDFSSDIKAQVALHMRTLDFRSPQTFYAACAYATEASAWRTATPPSLSDASLLAALAASKLYEHEYWLLDDVEDKLGVSLLADVLVFERSLIRARAGRLLIPFTETSRLVETHAPWLFAKHGKRRRIGEPCKRRDESAPYSISASDNSRQGPSIVRAKSDL
jgi:serine/threonine protein kinase